MVQVPNTADLPQPLAQARRHTDPPQLWVAVAIASLGVHAWLLVITLPMMRGSTAQPQTASVPIELIELSPNTTAVGETAAPSSNTATPSASRSAASDAPQSSSTASPAQPSPTQIAPTETITPPPDQFREPDVTPSDRPTPRPSVPPAIPSPQPSANVPTEPPQTPLPPDQPSPSPNLPSPNPGNEASGDSSSPTSNTPLPSPPAIGEPSPNPDSSSSGSVSNPSPSLPSVPVSETPQFSSFSANLAFHGLIPEVEQRDVPEHHPEPVENRQTYEPDDANFGTCLLSAGSVPDFGQTVYVQVVVEADGHVSDAVARQDQNPQISEAYRELAECLVKTWTFQPAYNTVEGEPRPVADSNSVVAITIRR